MSSNYREELNEIMGKLKSSQRTTKKEAFKSLQDLIYRMKGANCLRGIEKKDWKQAIHIIMDYVKEEISNQSKLKRPTIKKDISEPFKYIAKYLLNSKDNDSYFDLDKSELLFDKKVMKELLELIYDILKSFVNLWEHLMFDFCHILQSIFSCRHYMIKLSGDTFIQYFEFFSKILTDPANILSKLSSTDQHQVAIALETLLLRYPKDLKGYHNQILHFFQQFISRLEKKDYEKKILGFLLRSLNLFLSQHAQDMIISVRKMAEEFTDKLGEIWRNTREGDVSKIEVIQFFRIVLRLRLNDSYLPIHASCISKLFILVRDALNGGRIFSMRVKNLNMRQKLDQDIKREVFFDFAADICHFMKLVQENENSDDEKQQDQKPKLKKRKKQFEKIEDQMLSVLSSIGYEADSTSSIISTINREESLENWAVMISFYIKKYIGLSESSKLNVIESNFVYGILQRCKEKLECQHILQLIHQSIKLADLSSESETWKIVRENIYPQLCKLISMEASDLIPLVLSTVHVIIIKSPTLFKRKIFENLVTLLCDSKYLQEPRYCCSGLLLLISDINTYEMRIKREQHESVGVLNLHGKSTADFIKYMFDSIIFGLFKKDMDLSAFIYGITFSNLIKKEGFYSDFISPIDVAKEHDEKLIMTRDSIFKRGLQNLEEIIHLFPRESTAQAGKICEGSNNTTVFLKDEINTEQVDVFFSLLDSTLKQLIGGGIQATITRRYESKDSTSDVPSLVFLLGSLLTLLSTFCGDNYGEDDLFVNSVCIRINSILNYISQRIEAETNLNCFENMMTSLKNVCVPVNLCRFASKFQNSVAAILEKIITLTKGHANSSGSSQKSSIESAFGLSPELDDNHDAHMMLLDDDSSQSLLSAASCNLPKHFKIEFLSFDLVSQLLKSMIGHKNTESAQNMYKMVIEFLDKKFESTESITMKLKACDCMSYLSDSLVAQQVSIEKITKILSSYQGDNIGRSYSLMIVNRVLNNLANEKSWHTHITFNEVLDSCLNILDAFHNMMEKNNSYSEQIGLRFIECLHTALMHFPNQSSIFLERFCSFIKISSFMIGSFMANNIDIIFSIVSEHKQMDHFSTIVSYLSEFLEIADDADESLSQRNAWVCLGHLTYCNIEPIENESLFILLRCYKNANPIKREILRKIFYHSSLSLGYTCTREMLHEKVFVTFFKWIENNLDIIQFPYQLLDQSSVCEFVENYGVFIYPVLIEFELLGEFLSLVKLLEDQSERSILMKHIDVVYSTTIMLEIRDTEKGHRVFQNFIQKIINDNSQVELLLRNNLDNILVQLLLFSSISDSFDQKKCSEEIIQAFQLISTKKLKQGSVHSMLRQSKRRVLEIILNIHEHLEYKRRNKNKERLFQVFIIFLRYILTDLVISIESVLRSVINLLLSVLRKNESTTGEQNTSIKEEACKMIMQISDMALDENRDQPSTKSEFGKYYKAIIDTLVSLVPSDASYKSKANDIVFTLLDRLLKEHSGQMKEYIQNLDPFPDTPIFSSYNDIYLKARGLNESIFQEIDVFTKRWIKNRLNSYASTASNMQILTPGQSGLVRLHKMMKSSKEELIQGLSNSTGSIDDENSPLNGRMHIAARLASQLLQICSGRHYCSQDRVLAGECLGELGLLSPFSSADFTSLHRECEFDNFFLKIPSSEWNSTDIFKMAKKHILIEVNKYIADSDISLVIVAANTLRAILKTSSAKDIFKELDQELQLLLQPFLSSPVEKNHCSKLSSHLVTNILPNNKIQEIKEKVSKSSCYCKDIFDPKNYINHAEWIKSVVYALLTNEDINDQVLKLCNDICFHKAELAEMLFPLIIYDLSQSPKQKIISKHLSLLFDMVLKTASESRTTRLVLSTLNMLHRNNRELIKTLKTVSNLQSGTTYWLSLSYLTVARAAIVAGAYFTAIMCIEEFFQDKYALRTLDANEICFEEDSTPEYSLLLECYRNIDEPDSIYGVNVNYGLKSQLLKLEHEGDWEKVLGTYDVLANSTKNERIPESHAGIVASLQNLGHNITSAMYLKGIISKEMNGTEKISTALVDRYFENAWRRCKWDVSDIYKISGCADSENTGNTFHHSLFHCLKSLSHGDAITFRRSYEEALSFILDSLANNTASYHLNLTKLQMLTELVETWEAKTDGMGFNIGKIRWLNNSLKMSCSEYPFDCFEQIFALRIAMSRLVLTPYETITQVIRLSNAARKEGRYQLASNLIHNIHSQEKDNNKKLMPIWLKEECKILWEQGDREYAVNVAKFLVTILRNDIESSESSEKDRELLGSVCLLIGKWLGHSRAEESTQIVNTYLNDATKLCKNQCKAYYTLGQFLDSLYTNIERHTKSEEYKISQDIWSVNSKMLKEYEQHLSSTRQTTKKRDPIDEQIRRQYSNLKKTCELTNEEHKKLKKNQKEFLVQAIISYGEASSYANSKYDTTIVFRICSLWFSNSKDKSVNTEVMNLVKKRKIASYKFLPLVYQIASRLGGNPEDSFTIAHREILILMASEHPHHCLYQIFALANGKIIESDKIAGNYQVQIDKVNSAKEILKTLRQKGTIRQIIEEMDLLIEAYNELAILNLRQQKVKIERTVNPLKYSATMKIPNIKCLMHVPITTNEIPVRPDGRYENTFAFVDEFEKTFSLAGGVNVPKIVYCKGSDGVRYKQLVKGNDDMRQDAVMEQLFRLVNELLGQNKESRKRNLSLRTYKVVPLTPTTGVLAWVENTIPLGEYLISQEGAHKRYRPKDWTHTQCRSRFLDATKNNHTNERLYSLFMDVCKNFKPVFHHFFLEYFPNPADWFCKRLNYTRSVASNSIVGYIIGLGDRHCHNILIDQITAEAIHIDLGIAFEMGKILPTPERVPFRLTRDIIDGFGVSGVEGVFRRCSEIVLKVLRQNSDLLLTVVEVFLHDPLFRWNLSPLEAFKAQRLHGPDDEEDHSSHHITKSSSIVTGQQDHHRKNLDAERALIRLKEKLQGYEDGEILSIQGQTNKLISQARDNVILSRMYHGWAPWV